MRHERHFAIRVLLLVVLMASVTFAAAQSTGSSLRGYVKDSQGGVLPGVVVTATSPDMIQPATGITDETGYYRLINLPPGEYAITAELPGFSTYQREGILLRAAVNFQVDFTMSLGTLSETINTQYSYNSAYQSWSSNFLLMVNQQPARAFQLTIVGRF
ncbi:MAG TPA: carboxypeptidase-like regulatory domain-containing protein [Vicinamibacterales bacterium]|nr:carboxypeptidase-like regulatory domain-containing protein [Vicinamibacterales bacterium]